MASYPPNMCDPIQANKQDEKPIEMNALGLIESAFNKKLDSIKKKNEIIVFHSILQ